ncbi:unnamed protein product [Orchesella dallaii]|uniref:Uncharacterized protein n=1 Tax=Orchesella dallaii TaxID=48710 RepID=A0ABP1QHL1_9HEXA
MTNFLICESKLFSAILTCYPLLLNVLLIYPYCKYISFSAQGDWYLYIFQTTKLVGFLVDAVLNNFVDTYVAVLAISGYDIVRKNLAALKFLRENNISKEQWQNGDFSCILEIAERLENFFITLNSIGSHIILTWFCMLVTWISYKVLDSLPGTSQNFLGGGKSPFNPWVNMFHYWIFFGTYVLTLVLFAEIQREVI